MQLTIFDSELVWYWLFLSFGFVVSLSENGTTHADTGGMMSNLCLGGELLLLRNLQTCPCSAQVIRRLGGSVSKAVAWGQIIGQKQWGHPVLQLSSVLWICLNWKLLEEGTLFLDEKIKFIYLTGFHSWFGYINTCLLSSPDVFTWMNTFSFLPSFSRCLFNFYAKLHDRSVTSLGRQFQSHLD